MMEIQVLFLVCIFILPEASQKTMTGDPHFYRTRKLTSETPNVRIPRQMLVVIKEWWCSRARVCHPAGPPVCGWEARYETRMRFNSDCDMMRHNCQFIRDFRTLPPEECGIRIKKQL